jgi:F0F1-type ATP synthase membrane subunit b/b'
VASNDVFSTAEFFLVRLAIFLIFLVGLVKVCWDTLRKILK